jgi:hypothetical protein
MLMVGAGWGSRNPVLSLENLYINRYTNPANLNCIERRLVYHLCLLGTNGINML